LAAGLNLDQLGKLTALARPPRISDKGCVKKEQRDERGDERGGKTQKIKGGMKHDA